MSAAPTSRAAALARVPVSRETEARLAIYVDLLARWRKITNLISESTFADVWLRHIADSAQLLSLAPNARRWVDLGSGAGFPGLVIAIQLADVAQAQVHLVESDQRKCAFLREVARETGAPAVIHPIRIEAIDPASVTPVDAVTARALAPLPALLDFSRVWLHQGATGIFPRGRSFGAQLEADPVGDDFTFESIASTIDPAGAIIRVRSAIVSPA